MKTKSVGPILAIAIVAGLTASFALYVKHAEVKVRKQATHLNQLAVQKPPVDLDSKPMFLQL